MAQYAISRLSINSPCQERPSQRACHRQTRLFTCNDLRVAVNDELRTRVDQLLGPGNFHLLTAPPNTTGPRRSNGRTAT